MLELPKQPRRDLNFLFNIIQLFTISFPEISFARRPSLHNVLPSKGTCVTGNRSRYRLIGGTSSVKIGDQEVALLESTY